MITETIIEHINEIPEYAFSMENPILVETQYSRPSTFPEINFVCEVKMILCNHTRYRECFQMINDQYKLIDGRIQNPELKKQFEKIINGNGIEPDLVIHKSQQDINPKNQIFSMECKIDPNLSYERFKRDLFKLMLYREILNFKENLFLIANNENTKITNFYKQYKNEKIFFSASGIKILNIECFGSVPEIIYES